MYDSNTMAADDTKPGESTTPEPEEHKAEATPHAEPHAEPAAEPAPAAEAPTEPVAPKADPMKQMEDAAGQMEASLDKAFQGESGAQRRMILAIVLAIFGFGWIGTIINGQVMKGVAYVIGIVALGVIGSATCLGFLLFIPYYFFMLADTIILALRVKSGARLGQWEFCFKK